MVSRRSARCDGRRAGSAGCGLRADHKAGGAVLLMLTPVRNTISRRHERQADQYALAVTKKPAAFISGLRRLARQSLAEEHPSRLAELLFYSHPPLSDRLATANLAKLSNF